VGNKLLSIVQQDRAVSKPVKSGEKKMPNVPAKLPPGRPKGSISELAAYARYKLEGGRKAVEGLLNIAETGKREADRIRAWEVLMDRGFGKSVDVQVLAHITDDQASAREIVGLSANVLEVLSRALNAQQAKGGAALPAGDVVDVTPEPEPAPADEPTDT
jgi:hypothetical protein